MSILLRDLRLYGSAVMPEDDVTTAIGGAIALGVRVVFVDVSGSVQLVSDSAADTTPTVTVTYRDAGGALQTEVKTLTGLTPVVYTATMERLLKAVKSGTCAGNVAVENQTAVRSNTATAGSAADITLDAGASAVDDAYRGQIIRLTGGTGAGQVRQVIGYGGPARLATVSSAWTTPPDATSTFRLAEGFFFEKAPNEALTVRRIFYGAAADAPGGAARALHEKVFFKNCHATLALLGATVTESADPSTLVTFTLETTNDGTGTNGANTRLVALASGVGTFSSAAQTPAGAQLAAGEAVGVWIKLALAAGAPALNTTWSLALAGTTV